MTYKDKLEELLKEFEIYGDLDGIQDIKPYMKAIENMLNRNKELKEENKELKKDNKRYEKELHDVIEFSIPVSSVKEKIEELDIKITYIESQYTNGGQNCNSNYLSALYQKQILQELLEKR